MNAKLTIMVGLPGSGKSTYINKLDGEVVSTDEIRKELYGDASIQGKGSEVFALAFERTKTLLENGIDVIFDATNLTKANRKNVIKLADKTDTVECLFINTPIDECIKRNDNRDRKVPHKVIYRMAKRLEKPSYSEGFDWIWVI